ncbi:hypothetical protein NMG60_11027484 [Bertholletia excelsa]
MVSQTIALETASAVQMTIDEVKRTAQQSVNRALKDQVRFSLDLDIAAPKITIPTDFCPDNSHSTKLLLDLGNLVIRSQDDGEWSLPDEMNVYLQFDLILSDVSAFFVDGDYSWSRSSRDRSSGATNCDVVSFLPLVDKCGVILKLQQIRSENPSYPSTRLAMRVPSLGFHFSPARYHRLMQVTKIFQQEEGDSADKIHPWNQADFEGWLSVLTWKGVGNREAVWKRRFLCLVGPFLYVLEGPDSNSYKQYFSLLGKQLYQIPAELVGNVEHVLAVCNSLRSNNKVVEDLNALILRCDSDDSRRNWQNRLQGAIYRASASAPITSMSETSSDGDDSGKEFIENNGLMAVSNLEKVFITGVLDELKISFNYNRQHDQSFMKVLLAEESRLFEFRAIGGQVELSIRANDMFIGTVLKSLEIEDLVCRKEMSQPCYLARSFIGSTDVPETSEFFDAESQRNNSGDLDQCEGDEKFYEAPENLNDSFDSPVGNISDYLNSRSSVLSRKSPLRPPSFSHVPGLLPDDTLRGRGDGMEPTDTLDSFVKAQIVIYDQSSVLYHNIDKRVTVTLATLSFFCRRPTILAIMDFVNAINIQDESFESFSDHTSVAVAQHDIFQEEDIDNRHPTLVEEPTVKGLLGKGKSRIIFYLALNMARAQILLMNENGSKLATLSQDNLLSDIKVFPSSFSIKAALGNLRISDDSLHSGHIYYWVCDMRNPGGSSFVELVFSSFTAEDEDYEGYDYSLSGQLSEVRIVYLNRFIQEVTSYFMGLVPSNSKDVVKIQDQATNSEKWFTTSEIEGLPAVKLDLSLRRPIILMPRRTDSLDFLKLDIVHITVQNTFQWFGGTKNEMHAVHVEILTVLVEDINVNVGCGAELGENIIQDVQGVNIVIRRSLRDLLHQVPCTEVAVKIEKLKAALSNREYQIITECAVSNVSESPNVIPPLNYDSGKSMIDVREPLIHEDCPSIDPETQNKATWTTTKVSVDINLVELCLHYGMARDASLATMQVSGAWLLYKSSDLGEGFLYVSLKDFSVIDDREGTEEALRLAVGKSEYIGCGSSQYLTDDKGNHLAGKGVQHNGGVKLIPTMLILDAKFGQYATCVSLCIQRPRLLVALDFLLAVVEYFVPSVHGMLSNAEDENFTHIIDAIILDQPTYSQPLPEFSLSPQRPLVVDDERFDCFIYDGRGGTLYLHDRQGRNLSSPSSEALIYVGNGKRLEFKNIIIKNGWYLDSCIFLGTNSSYSASENDQVYFEGVNEGFQSNSFGQNTESVGSQSTPVQSSTEFIFELQAIGPELTFYNTSKDAGESLVLSNRLLHAQLDAFCRLVMKGETMDMNANALGLTMESNGIRILEPFDTSIKFSNASGKMNIHFSVSNIFMNFSFSILRLFLAVEEDILAFLRMTSKKMTVSCSEFDRVGAVENSSGEQVYVFWRPRAPPGFAVLGDYLTPLNKPPAKGVLAVNTSIVRVKRPVSFKLVWPPKTNNDISEFQRVDNHNNCSIWFPEAPEGYVAMGCVVSIGRTPPPLSSAFCILTSLVSPCALRDCITISFNDPCSSSWAFWRVDNSVGTFLPADPSTLNLVGGAYDLRHIFFGHSETLPAFKSSENKAFPSDHPQRTQESERPSTVNSGRRFEAVASFQLIWWNQGLNSRKKLSIWRPMVAQGMVYFGDIAVEGYEPPNTCVVLHDSGGDELFKAPIDFQPVGRIKKRRHMESISFWLPQAPPGFVSLGCVACKGSPKQSEFSALRCLRNDMVAGDQFLEESIWDTSEIRFMKEPFSIWTTGNDLGTFIVRSGFKKPPRRFALKLADPDRPTGSDDTVIDAEMGTFSAAFFDDYGGLMVPLFNISLSGIGFSLHGRPEYLNSTVSFSLAGRSYNDKYESWEPVIEPVDGFLRYQYDQNAPGAASQLRLTCMGDLILNVSVPNANMILQAYASWKNLSLADKPYREREVGSPNYGGPFIDVHHKRNYYIVPQNKLGQDIFIRPTEVRGLPNIIKMSSGDMKPLKVPVWKNMLESHLKGHLFKTHRTMVTVIIAEAELQRVEGLASNQYMVAIHLGLEQGISGGSVLSQQSARTRGSSSDQTEPSDLEYVCWNEIFFFRVESLDHYVVELIVTDMGKGDPIGYFSASLKQITSNYNQLNEFIWMDLSPAESVKITHGGKPQKSCGRIRCAVPLLPSFEVEDSKLSSVGSRKSGFIQISPSREGPWTNVRLNYAAPAACWRLGDDVVASEVSVKHGNRYVNIRSLVSVQNNTDFILDLCLKLGDTARNLSSPEDAERPNKIQTDVNRIETEEIFETEKYIPDIGWVSSSDQPNPDFSDGTSDDQGTFGVELPSGWQWIDNWHIDLASVTTDGWVYAPDLESLKWPASFDPLRFVNYARQRRWIRNRKQISGVIQQQIVVGQLKPGETVPLPLFGLTHFYILQLRPLGVNSPDEYTWSSVMDWPEQAEESCREKESSEICVSALTESQKLLYCSEISGDSSNSSHGMWFCLSIQATEIAKDIHSDPIQDWSLVVKSPLSITNYLPLAAEFSVLKMRTDCCFAVCSRGVLGQGKTVKIYDADIRKPLYFSLLPQRGWLPIHGAVLISHPNGNPSKTISLRSSISGRIVQIILEQNQSKENPLVARTIRVYSPYWFAIARCPPLTLRLLDMAGRKQGRKIAFPFQSKKHNELIHEEITDEEIYEGYTIASALNFKMLGLSVSIAQSGREQFGPVKDLSPLGDMDGSLDISAYDADGNCMRLFISSRPCSYQSVPTKVISVRPFITFTNRIGQDMYVKLSNEDAPKTLHAFDCRVSFVFREDNGPNKLQVRLEDTDWSFPVNILKEDTIFLVLRKHDNSRRFLRAEIRGYEEGSRFIVVFRLGSMNGPIRLENRTINQTVSIRQTGCSDHAFIQLEPLSATNFSWEDPYGQRLIDAKIHNSHSTIVCNLDLDKMGSSAVGDGALGLSFHVVEMGDIKVARFTDDTTTGSSSKQGGNLLTNVGNLGNCQHNKPENASPVEIIAELVAVGISVVDHKPKELSYLYLERVFVSYSTGYDSGTTSRFKLILGHLQIDNQLPLTLMPVLLAPEHTSDLHHPVFKMTITIRNENPDGIQIYPYVYIRVTEDCWRLNIHEPIIWAFVDFYKNLQLDRVDQSPSVTQVDPEIRIDLIDVSEVRLKVSLETAPAQRPQGVLGVWSPILSAVGNAFKIQVHLRRVMHRDRFMRKSSIIPAIGNRVWRDLIHNPLHLIFSVDVLGMTSSTLASLSKRFAELSTDGQFLQLRMKQVWSRRITGVGDGIMQGTEALAQGVAFGVSGVVKKPMESARQNGLLGLAHGLGQAFLGIIVQPVSGALDFFSLTVDGIGASCSRCLEVFNHRTAFQRIRNPRVVHADNILREYCEREATGQMILYLAEASWHFGCTEIFKEPSKFAWSDYYEDHFIVPYQRIVLVTNKRVMLLQCLALDKMDKKPCKIMWDVPWEELMTMELAKAGNRIPSHLILHLKNFRRSEAFVRVIKCSVEGEPEGLEPQAVRICSTVRKMWKAYQSHIKSLTLKVPSSQRYVHFAWSEADKRDLHSQNKAMIKSRKILSSSSLSDERRFIKHSVNFEKIWGSEQEPKNRCTLCRKQVSEDSQICSIWRPICPDGYVSVGDIAHIGTHAPNVAAVYHNRNTLFALPVGYDLVWRNCPDDYITPISIWHPRAPGGFVPLGCVAVSGFREPEPDSIYCVAESLAEETVFEEQKIWSAPDSYPWSCHIYQVKSDALHFVALRQPREESDWKPVRVLDESQPPLQPSASQ